jgi:hypothetical protein
VCASIEALLILTDAIDFGYPQSTAQPRRRRQRIVPTKRVWRGLGSRKAGYAIHVSPFDGADERRSPAKRPVWTRMPSVEESLDVGSATRGDTNPETGQHTLSAEGSI